MSHLLTAHCRQRSQQALSEQRHRLPTQLGAGRSPLGPMQALLPGAAGIMPNPLHVDINSKLEKYVLAAQEESKKEGGTAKAFGPKIQEFHQHCDYCYANHYSEHQLDYDKVCRFMFHQMFREKRKGGANENNRNGIYFLKEDYDGVMASLYATPTTAGGDMTHLPPDPKDPVGVCACSQWKAVFRVVCECEVANRHTSLAWEHIWQMGFDALFAHAKTRMADKKKANCEEKHNGEFAPYAIAEHMTELEELMWKDSAKAVGSRSVATQLRHNCCFKHLTSAVLRCESLYSADCSDAFGLKIPKKNADVNRPFIMLSQITHGETNHGGTLCGRTTRHKDVRRCSVGGLGFYWQCRFNSTREFGEMTLDDWLDNHKWFNIKLLTCIGSPDNTKPLQNDSHGDHIKDALDQLGLPNSKLLHLGRDIGAKEMDPQEVTPEDMKRMGNWSPGVFDASYSSKIPMIPIRKLAGFDGKFHCLPRDGVEPEDHHLRSTPMGEWCYAASEEVLAADILNKHNTAVTFLRFCCDLSGASLQDAAAMAVLCPEREEHPFCKDIPAFHSEDFEELKTKMKRELENHEDPSNASMETVSPGLVSWHTANNNELKSLKANVNGLEEAVREAIVFVQQESESRDRRMAGVCIELATRLLGRPADLDRLNLKGMNSLLGGITSPATPTTPTTATDADSEGSDDEFAGAFGPVVAVGHAGAPIQIQTNADTGTRQNPTLDLGAASKKQLVARHSSVSSLLDEWLGRNYFADEFGGLQGRETNFKSKWRASFTANQKLQFSRASRVCKALIQLAQQEGKPLEEVAAEWEDRHTQSNESASNFLLKPQSDGVVPKKANRGRKKKD